MMCYRLAAELSPRIAAVAPVAGTLVLQNCRPERPVSILHFHGTEDRFVPFYGSNARWTRYVAYRPVEAAINTWVEIDNCPRQPQLTDVPGKGEAGIRIKCRSYGPGKDGAEVVLYVIEGGGHIWPGMKIPGGFLGRSTQALSANDLMWEFFQKHSFAEAPRPPAVSLNATIMIRDGRSWNEAPNLIDRVVQQGHRRVNLVLNLYAQLDQDLQVKSFGLRHPAREPEGEPYTPFNEELRVLRRQQLQAIFTRAIQHNLDITLLPQLTAAGSVSGWGNRFDFDPLQHYANHSYKEIMIDDVVEALAPVVRPTTRIDWVLAGDMGRATFAHADSWKQIMSALRERPGLRCLKAGVSFDFKEVAGKYQSKSGSASVQKLIDSSDFLGFSCYGVLSVPPRVQDFTAMVTAFADALKKQGVDIPPGMPLHLSEVGLGGGGRSERQRDIGMAQEPAEAARSPWSGTNDPRKNPWTTEKMKTFRQDYHRALLDFLRTQPAPWPIRAAFLWDTGSWCPYGFDHPVFQDGAIMDMIRQHNAQVKN